MVVNKLELINFRNYLNLSLNFNNKINFIVGENAEGKTNLVEGIYTLSLAKSFRTQNTIELIKNNEEKAIVKGTIVSLSNYKKIEIEFNKFGKKVLINSKPIKKISELNKILNVIYFIPKDVILLKDTPKSRRQFLDLSISKLNNEYLKNVINYEKILKERNDLLKTYPLNNILFDILTDNLIELSKEIYKSRLDFILDDILSEFDDEHEKNLLNYLNDFGQIFITGCKKSKYYTSTYYEVTNKKVEIKE